MERSDAEIRQFRRMTEAPVPGLVVSLAVPTIFTMLITAFYNMAVGNDGNPGADVLDHAHLVGDHHHGDA